MKTSRLLVLAGGTVAVLFAGLFFLRASSHNGKKASEGNPFVYSLEEFRRTEPALVRYRQALTIQCTMHPVTGLAVDGSDRIFVVSTNQVEIFDSTGTQLALLTLNCTRPVRCVAVGPGGEILVGATDHVEAYDLSGSPTARWASLGKKALITSVSALSEEVFVADAGNRRVWRFDRQGRLKSEIKGIAGNESAAPSFVVPSASFDVVADPRGSVWVANPGQLRVEQYSFEGQLLSVWGQAGMGIQAFCGCCNPSHLALLSNGSFVTSEKGLPRVKIYDRSGAFSGVVAGAEDFAEGVTGLDLAVDSADRILVLDPHLLAVRIFVEKR
ncbi:MAG: NHL repeat-containing protein [Kiritimatiellia bacterium]